MFYCVLRSLSSCDHLDLEKSPSVRETNGTATGSRYIGRSKNLQSIGSKLQQISTLLCIPGLRLESDNTLDPLPFSLLKKNPFRSMALEKGCQEDTTQWARQCLWDTLLFSHGFFRFPVWSAGESFCISCQNCASATRPHCSLHTDLIPQPLQDLLYCYSSLPRFLPWRVLVSFLLLKHCICEWK